ncbi:MAG: peptidase S8, partial [Candidatus Bathyarchaeota archaeon]|nr:peptidase S8 [Candidatus Bathyarchaeota archaeon]
MKSPQSGKIMLFCVLLLLLCSTTHLPPAAPIKPNEVELLLRFKPGVSRRVSEALLNSLGAKVVDEMPWIDVLVISVPSHALNNVKSALMRNPIVDFVEENHLVKPMLEPNDPYYSNQWHLPNIDAPRAW